MTVQFVLNCVISERNGSSQNNPKASKLSQRESNGKCMISSGGDIAKAPVYCPRKEPLADWSAGLGIHYHSMSTWDGLVLGALGVIWEMVSPKTTQAQRKPIQT